MRPASVGFHCPDDVAMARKSTRAPRTSVGAVLRDSPPIATFGLIAANIAVYAVTAVQSKDGINNPQDGGYNSLFFKWQLQPVLVHADHSYWQLLTSAFVHLSLIHIASNMLALFFVGPVLERLIGPTRFVALYLLAALGGSAAIYIFGSPYLATVGASGAIFGLFAACLVMVRKLGLDLQWLIAIIVLNFVFTFSVPGISKLGHIGGFVTGLVAAVTIAGLPKARARVPDRVQVLGLTGIGVALVVAVALRSALGTF
jgi:membrane associated rhomboid family serine protease